MWAVVDLAKKRLERATGIRVFRNSLPFGCDAIHDLKRAFAGFGASKTIIDVGAHWGESVVRFRDSFPDARIHAFEPVSENRRVLAEAVKTDPGVRVYPFAVGSIEGTATLHKAGHSAMHSLANADRAVSSEQVSTVTLDSFCAREGLRHIDFCKIDTEGFDLEVLRGARELLTAQRIDLVQVESSLRHDVGYFVPLWDIAAMMNEMRYELFGIYEQQPCWTGRKSLLFFNAVYVRTSLVENLIPF